MNKADTALILVCAGNATRMGGIHKILHPLGNTTVLHQVLRSFCQCESIAEFLVICREQDIPAFEAALSEIGEIQNRPVTLVGGGATRQQSVRNGFSALHSDAEYVAIHDGARPLVQPSDIEKTIADARKAGAATLGAPVKDTIKIVEGTTITATPPRDTLRLTYTPQVFRRALYAEALDLAQQQGKDYTDDCQLVEALGVCVTMTEGAYSNIKLTTPEDFAIAEALLKFQSSENGGA